MNFSRRVVLAASLTASCFGAAAVAAPVIASADVNKGAIAVVSAAYDGNILTITSSKDLSNVVVSVSGVHTKYEGLRGKTLTLSVVGADTVWVKSGNNKSGDGPGYGERIDLTGSSSAESVAYS